MKDYYVYALFDADGIVRYIGKGHGYRWTQHASDKRRPKSFIQDAIERIGDYPRIKIRDGLSEFDAYQVEQALIEAIGIEPDGPLVNRTSKGSGPNSASIKTWYAKFTSEERRAKMTPAISASVAARSKLPQEKRREMIAPALHALTENHHIMAAKRLNDSLTPESRAKAKQKALAKTTPEERSAISRKAISSQSKEQLSAIGRRGNEFITPEVRSEIGRKRASHLTPEQRQENARRLINSQTREQLSENGRKAAASLTPEQRSEMARRRAANMSPEKKHEIAMKMVAGRLAKREKRRLD